MTHSMVGGERADRESSFLRIKQAKRSVPEQKKEFPYSPVRWDEAVTKS